MQADRANVQMLSGYSPALMKLALAGEFEEEIIEQEEVVDGVVVVTKVKKKITPFDTFRKAVEDKCFDRIRAVLTRSNEDIFAHYNWMKEDSGDNSQKCLRSVLTAIGGRVFNIIKSKDILIIKFYFIKKNYNK